MSYYYKCNIVNSLIIIIDDWRCNQQGVHKLPKSNSQVKKSYFMSDGKFSKHAYELLPPSVDNMMTVIHYFGNEEVAVPFAHGNSNASSSKSRNCVRICPSVLKAVEEISAIDLCILIFFVG